MFDFPPISSHFVPFEAMDKFGLFFYWLGVHRHKTMIGQRRPCWKGASVSGIDFC